jgi:hypothetical protein
MQDPLRLDNRLLWRYLALTSLWALLLLAGTIATDGALTITAGGAGTSAIGQVIQELSIR